MKYADGSTPPNANTWTFAVANAQLDVTASDQVVFSWSAQSGPSHSLATVPSLTAWTNCDLSKTNILVASAASGQYTLNAAGLAGQTVYFVCTVSAFTFSFAVQKKRLKTNFDFFAG